MNMDELYRQNMTIHLPREELSDIFAIDKVQASNGFLGIALMLCFWLRSGRDFGNQVRPFSGDNTCSIVQFERACQPW